MLTGCVYLLENKINRKVYIGITNAADPDEYVLVHKIRAEKGEKPGRLIYDAIREYSWDNFELTWLHYKDVHPDELDALEEQYIAEYQAADPDYGYNMILGGAGIKGWTHSEEAKQRIAEGNKGRKRSQEHKKRMSDGMKKYWANKKKGKDNV